MQQQRRIGSRRRKRNNQRNNRKNNQSLLLKTSPLGQHGLEVVNHNNHKQRNLRLHPPKQKSNGRRSNPGSIYRAGPHLKSKNHKLRRLQLNQNIKRIKQKNNLGTRDGGLLKKSLNKQSKLRTNHQVALIRLKRNRQVPKWGRRKPSLRKLNLFKKAPIYKFHSIFKNPIVQISPSLRDFQIKEPHLKVPVSQ